MNTATRKPNTNSSSNGYHWISIVFVYCFKGSNQNNHSLYNVFIHITTDTNCIIRGGTPDTPIICLGTMKFNILKA